MLCKGLLQHLAGGLLQSGKSTPVRPSIQCTVTMLQACCFVTGAEISTCWQDPGLDPLPCRCNAFSVIWPLSIPELALCHIREGSQSWATGICPGAWPYRHQCSLPAPGAQQGQVSQARQPILIRPIQGRQQRQPRPRPGPSCPGTHSGCQPQARHRRQARPAPRQRTEHSIRAGLRGCTGTAEQGAAPVWRECGRQSGRRRPGYASARARARTGSPGSPDAGARCCAAGRLHLIW